jgi:hypothetical protein
LTEAEQVNVVGPILELLDQDLENDIFRNELHGAL